MKTPVMAAATAVFLLSTAAYAQSYNHNNQSQTQLAQQTDQKKANKAKARHNAAVTTRQRAEQRSLNQQSRKVQAQRQNLKQERQLTQTERLRYRQDLRQERQATRRYRYNAYLAPTGYSYRRWSYGGVLPRAYWAQNYWIGNYSQFGLVAAPVGFTWVRYGPDAMLIDTYDGSIVRVEYGLFY